MDSTLNEYVHENFRVTTRSGKIKIFYEPLEHAASYIKGFIYYKGVEIQRFSNLQIDLVFGTIFRENIVDSPFPVKGLFNSNRDIVLIWNKDPQEHFLCVSYTHEYITNKFTNNKNNWCLEGF